MEDLLQVRKRQMFLFNQTRVEFSDLQMVSWGCLSGGSVVSV